MLRQDGPLRTLLSSFTTLTLIRLQVLRYCLFELTVCCWFIIGPDRQRFQLGMFGISFPTRKPHCMYLQFTHPRKTGNIRKLHGVGLGLGLVVPSYCSMYTRNRAVK